MSPKTKKRIPAIITLFTAFVSGLNWLEKGKFLLGWTVLIVTSLGFGVFFWRTFRTKKTAKEGK